MCQAVINLTETGNFNPQFKKIPKSVTDDYIKSVYDLKTKSGDVHPEMFRETYERLKNSAELGFGKRFTDFSDLKEFELFQKTGMNLSRFSAHRMESMNQALIAELYDANGAKLSKADFDLRAKKIVRRYNQYLKTETMTARRRANIADKWQEFERRADIYPNVKFVTMQDDLVRDTHKVLHGIIRPINDPFWKTHRPPLAWNCRCNVVQTDKAATVVPADISEAIIQKGFEGDVMQGEIWSEKHPYYANIKDPSVLESLGNAAKMLRRDLEKTEILEIVREKFVKTELPFNFPNLPLPITLTNKSIKSVASHFHIQPDVKNALLLALPLVLAKGVQYVKSMPNDKKESKPNILDYHYFLFQLMDIDFYINVSRAVNDQTVGDVYKIYSIGELIK
jgi:SPP1 gp7 family putative phage head morphogenesis protein